MIGGGLGFGAPGGTSRFMTTRGRMQGSPANGVNYPHPFFDVAHTYLPATVKQLFRWCRYYFLTNPLINATVFKLSEYPITDIIVDHKSDRVRKRWEEYFQEHLRYRPFQIECGLDYHTYGNCMVSLGFPFHKYLKCPSCGYKERADKIRAAWTFTNLTFRLTCPKCQLTSEAEATDFYYKDANGIKLIRWNCEHIEINYNDVTGDSTYFYTIPPTVRNDIVIGKKDIVEGVPQVFIEAMRQKKGIVFAKDNFFHMKRPTLAQQDRGWGIPIVLPVLKDTFYLQLMKKAQEAILLEHIVPLRILFPQAGSGTADPYTTINLTDWRDHVASEIARWRQDNNYIPILPLPIGNQTVGGDGRALMLTQEISTWSEQLMSGLGVPREFLMGGMCLAPDSLVTSSAGLLRLDELVPLLSTGEAVRVRAHTGVAKATQGHRVGMKKAWRVKTRSGLELVGAGTHPIYVLQPDLSRTFTPIQELQAGQFTGVAVGAQIWPNRVPELAPYLDALTHVGGRYAKKDLETVCIPEKLTPELARLFGYVVSEGACTSSRRISFSNTDEALARDFEHCVQNTFGLVLKPAVSQYATSRSPTGVRTQYSYEISRQTAVEVLNRLGLVGDSYEKVIPSCIRKSPKMLVAQFLRAYFDGDGGCTDLESKQTIAAHSVSHQLLREVQLLLLNFGIVSSLYQPAAGKSTYTLQVRSHYVRSFAEQIGFTSPEKARRASAEVETRIAGNLSETIPYLREALLEARERHVHGFGAWKFEPVDLVLSKEWYSTSEIASLVNRDSSLIRGYIKAEKLQAELCAGSAGRFDYYRVSADSLRKFLTEHGLGRRKTFAVRGFQYSYEQLQMADLSAVQELEPELYQRVKDVEKEHLFWDEIVSIEELELEADMLDIGVEEVHSYQASGMICHNSYAGTNVSMRMLENQFLGFILRHKQMANWVMQMVANYMGWPEADIRFKPFKMADDIQRKAFLFQLNQAQKVSDRTLLADSDLDQVREDEIMIAETSMRLEASKMQQLAMAEIQGDASVVMAKAQAKAQQVQQKAMMAPQAPGEPGADMMGQMQSPLNMGQSQGLAPAPGQSAMAGVDIRQMAEQLAQQMAAMPPDQQQMALQNLQAQSPELAKLVEMMLRKMGASAPPMGDPNAAQQAASQVDMRPQPEQRAPRRAAAAV